jgi:hypothetical protein
LIKTIFLPILIIGILFMKLSVLLSLLFLVTVNARADTVTVVLQNGLNGYAGCLDTYIEQGVITPAGMDSLLKTSCG